MLFIPDFAALVTELALAQTLNFGTTNFLLNIVPALRTWTSILLYPIIVVLKAIDLFVPFEYIQAFNWKMRLSLASKAI